MFHRPASVMAQTPKLTKWHAYLYDILIYNRGELCQKILSLEMQHLLGLVEYIKTLNVSPPIPVLDPATCKEEIREVLAGAWYTDGSSQGNLST